ncbi:flavin reductase family protein [Actinoallomurus rhizosphaericola]|uniref:flavin reductase family protein n=1 Tax=Actinoallomurus rhizosphaericola TaxID=2952536 RepID=UPI002092EBB2|nr:flavin reductase family protein [Actinoallomurus rhizosphaericola]MCO5995878.1 flavin reductase family protein [Actinoallomurus rhizosphaericola]
MGDLRTMMAAFPTGVGIVAAVGADDRPWGMTCTSIASVALDPPCLLVCLRRGSPTLTAILEHGGFALNLLRADAQAAAELFASGAPDRFQRVRWTMNPGAEGPHLEDVAHSTADCRLLHQTTIGDHTVVYGQVTRINERGDVRPLMYGLREFAQWPASVLLSRGI